MRELEEIAVHFLIHCGSEENGATRLCGIRPLQMLIAALLRRWSEARVYFGGWNLLVCWANLLLLGLTLQAS